MKRLTFSIDIKAPKEKVWYSLWDDENYETWTKVFSEGSTATSDWKEGSKIYFHDGNGNGMISEIAMVKPFETMLFKHNGEIKDYQEKPATSETESWAGSEEGYELSETNGVTTVKAYVDVLPDHESYFSDKFPKALEKIKEIAESDKVKSLTIRTSINAPLQDVWNKFNNPGHVVNWNFASDDWHCPKAEGTLEAGKTFSATMAAKDGSMSFDFVGTYQEIIPQKKIMYTIADGRKVTVKFDKMDNQVIVTENFEPESVHPLEFQRGGWQAILDNFKKYAEKQ